VLLNCLVQPHGNNSPLRLQRCKFGCSTACFTSCTPSLISSTCGWTSQIKSCSARESFSMRPACSPSCFSSRFCLDEIEYIHQKQTPQQMVSMIVSQVINPAFSMRKHRSTALFPQDGRNAHLPHMNRIGLKDL